MNTAVNPDTIFVVVAGSFEKRANAEAHIRRLADKGVCSFLVEKTEIAPVSEVDELEDD
ncbi:MAG: hypothetical protein FWD35_01655 [Oscillospiraceae bacterium]|nr:hypothetical protein [Oscillospiraceae bacterium]